MAKQDIYQSVTNTIITAIESGQTGNKFVLPWNRYSALPQNAKTEKQYRGVNVPLLWAWQIECNYQSGIWATYRQWQDMGAQVKKGAKGVQIVFWKTVPSEPSADNQEGETRMFARWSTVFHELTHWTGAKHRLDREVHKKYGDNIYAFEELIAELGSAMCCASTGVESSVRNDHAQYIDNWLKAFKSDKKFIFAASSQAQKAVDYLLSF